METKLNHANSDRFPAELNYENNNPEIRSTIADRIAVNSLCMIALYIFIIFVRSLMFRIVEPI